MSTSSAIRFRISRDVWIGLLTAGGAVAYWRVADDIPISPLDGAVNAAVLPKALATAMVVFSLLLILRALVIEWVGLRAARAAAAQAEGAASAPSAPPTHDGQDFGWQQHLKAAGVLAIGIGYLLLLPIIGYVAGIFLLVTVLSIYIGARPGVMPAAVGAVIACAFYVLFKVVLGIPMPAGIFAGLLG